MEIIAYEMKLNKSKVDTPNIACIPFQKQYFEEYMRIYNECFYEMRKTLDIEPYHFLHDYEQIADKIKELKQWCDINNKSLHMLANSGCLCNCPMHTFHDNLVAHENEISKMDNAYQFYYFEKI